MNYQKQYSAFQGLNAKQNNVFYLKEIFLTYTKHSFIHSMACFIILCYENYYKYFTKQNLIHFIFWENNEKERNRVTSDNAWPLRLEMFMLQSRDMLLLLSSAIWGLTLATSRLRLRSPQDSPSRRHMVLDLKFVAWFM